MYRERKNDPNAHPPPTAFGLNPWKKFPKESLINKKLEDINKKLLEDHNILTTPCGVSIVVCRSETDAQKIISHFEVSKAWRYAKKYASAICR